MESVILPHTEFEDRTSLYEDVRLLLSPGFLNEAVSVGGHRFCLRSFSAEDFFLLRCRTGPTAPDHESKAWALATSIWMIDGQIVHEHQESLLRIHAMCMTMPTATLGHLYRYLIQLTKRMQEAARRAEAYLYEVESRYTWRGEGVRIMDRTPLRVGPNQIQRLWTFYNTVEDQREQNVFDWAQTKFVAGTQAPKGIQKLNAKEQKAELELDRKRQEVRDRMFYLAMGVPFPTKEESKQFYSVNPMETEQDLKAEMGRWLRGEKDWHDRIIDYVKNKIRRTVEDRRAEESQRIEELQQIVEEERPTSLEMLSPEMAEELRRRSRAPKRVVQDTTHNSAYDKYIAQEPIAGEMDVDPQTGIPRTRRVLDDAALKELREKLERGPEGSEDINSYLETHPPTVGE